MEADTAKFVADLGAGAAGKVIDAGERKFIGVPSGFHLKEVDPLEPRVLTFIKQKLKLETRTSFVEYVNAYKSEGTKVFFDRDTRTFSAVFDYHKKDTPDRIAHQATYACRHSDEWTAWTGIDGNPISQSDFAEFLEDHSLDVTQPVTAELLEMAQSLQIERKVSFVSAQRLGNGTVNFVYREEDEANGGKHNLPFPTGIALAIPVFRGEDRYAINAKFRYRMNEGKLAFIVKIERLEANLDDAINRMKFAISEAVILPVLEGLLT